MQAFKKYSSYSSGDPIPLNNVKTTTTQEQIRFLYSMLNLFYDYNLIGTNIVEAIPSHSIMAMFWSELRSRLRFEKLGCNSFRFFLILCRAIWTSSVIFLRSRLRHALVSKFLSSLWPCTESWVVPYTITCCLIIVCQN